ncbi:L-2-hydroxyglutarate oxidase [Arthrobacter sp. KNU-44]|uniref:L-2-hydroxyglutarate oxidase n=1 Tax=Arthrobacter sp. KNU-44 TaxID=3450744 RepID=UPI003F42F105
MYDFCVVGGGIVGLATGMTLLQQNPGASLLLLEKEDELACHQTGHNSGVIHSGIYYQPGSLKAQFSKQGEALTKEFCREQGLEYRTCGKLLVATEPAQLPRMNALEERAGLHSIPVERLDATDLSSLEPNVRGVGALFVPSTAIVDYREVSRSMADLIIELGGEIRTGEQATYIRESSGSVALRTARGLSLVCRKLVVCGGLQADRLARLAGLSTDTRIVPFRGEYFQLPERLQGFVSRLIYPIPDPSLPFLGVHLTPTLQGTVTVGPNAVLGMAREGYPKLSVSLRDIADYVVFPGFWAMARNNVRVGGREIRNSLFLRGYLKECRRFAPALEAGDLQPREAGIRAQAVASSGDLIHDFVLFETERMLHVINAPSPAATAAIPIAKELASRLGRRTARSA